MSEKTVAGQESKTGRTPIAAMPIGDTQLFYTEQMFGIAVGPFVSKIILSMDNSPNPPTPKLTIVMPTNAMHLMAKQILEVLSNQDTQKQFGNGYKTYQESVSS